MPVKKISKSVKRRLTILIPVFTVIFLISLFTFFTYMIRINNIKKERDKLLDEYEVLKAREEVLVNEIARLKDPEYIAKFAREKYYYTKNGEYVIRVEEEEIKDVVDNNMIDTKVYYLLTAAGSLIILLSFIAWIKQKKDMEINTNHKLSR